MNLAAPASLLSLCRRIEAGETTAAREFEAFAERAAAVEPILNAFAASDWSAARASASALADRPFRGLPIGVKDIYDTSSLQTSYGSSIHAGHRPKADAAMVGLLASLGASLPAKTTTTEFAFLQPTRTSNPWAVERSPGGSSAGSAAAVAGGMLPAAIGSQTAGSTIRPASFCGIAGFKPSFGCLPTTGMKAFAKSLDTVGLFTAGIDDMRFLFSNLRGAEPRFDRPEPSSLRIGIFASLHDEQASPAAKRAFASAISRFRKAGVRLRDVTMSEPMTRADEAHRVIQAYEGFASLSHEYEKHRQALSLQLASFLAAASKVSLDEYRHAKAEAAMARDSWRSAFEGCDGLLTFASADIAPVDHSSTGSPIFNRLWTLLGFPCVSIPGIQEMELPIGIQLIGPPGADDRTLALADTLRRQL